MSDLSLADLHERIAAEIPARECIVFRDLRLSYADVTERTRRLANFLTSRGLGCHKERADLAGQVAELRDRGFPIATGPLPDHELYDPRTAVLVRPDGIVAARIDPGEGADLASLTLATRR